MKENKIRFTVPGEIVGKARPKVCRKKNSNGVVAYTPPRTVQYEELIRYAYYKGYKDNKIGDNPFVITIDCFFEIKPSYPKWKKKACLEGKFPHTKTPDVDNIIKIVLDALNGMAYDDDKQCVAVACGKGWSQHEEYLTVELAWESE